jgi:hypothetical protein
MLSTIALLQNFKTLAVLGSSLKYEFNSVFNKLVEEGSATSVGMWLNIIIKYIDLN